MPISIEMVSEGDIHTNSIEMRIPIGMVPLQLFTDRNMYDLVQLYTY